jgi:hypothetical protein
VKIDNSNDGNKPEPEPFPRTTKQIDADGGVLANSYR